MALELMPHQTESKSFSSVYISVDTDTVSTDVCGMPIHINNDSSCNSSSIQDDPYIIKNHGEEPDQSICYNFVPNTRIASQNSSRFEKFDLTVPKQVNECSSKSQRVSKWKLVRSVVPLLGFKRRTHSTWSATINRINRFNTQLLDAIEEHNNGDIESILHAGANPNATCRAGLISACHAAAYANSDALRLLLALDAIKDRRDQCGRTPLHLAAWSGKPLTIAMLLGFSNDLQNKINNDVTPEAEEEIMALRPRLLSMIDVPCEQTKVSALRQIWKDGIEHRCSRYMTHLPRFSSGWTPLHIASYAAHHDATRLLLAAGANPNSKDATGQTPLDIVGAACYLESSRIHVDEYVNTIKTIIEFGGKLNVSETSTTPSNSSLHTAVELCSVEAIEILLAAGAPISLLNAKGNTPLHDCVTKRCKKTLQVLVNYDQSVDVVNRFGHTVLHTAILASWVPGVCIALDAGADVTFEANDGTTAIHIAALKGDLDIVNEILRNAAQYCNAVNRNNSRGDTPVFCAIRSGKIECVQAFLTAGASLKMTYCDPVSYELSARGTILHVTAEAGSVEILMLIFNHDESLEHLLCYKCHHLGNMIPVEYAAFHNRFHTFKYLLQKTLERTQKLQSTFDHSRLLHIIGNNKTLFEELMNQIPNAVRMANGKEYYPLHDAAKDSNRNLIVQLIDNGADLSKVDDNGITAISLIINNISKPTELLAKIFDNYITTTKNDTECEITVDYRALIPTTGDELEKNDQMRVVTTLLETEDRQNQRKLLAHPLVESFLYLKWTTLSIYFYLMVFLYSLFVMSLSCHVVSVFYYNDKYNKTMHERGIIPRVWDPQIWRYIIYCTLGVVVIQELSCSNLAPKTWTIKILSVEFWLKLITYGFAIATPIAIAIDIQKEHGHLDWQRHLATVTLVLAWLNIMMMLSKTPIAGYYIEMFWMVLSKVIEIFITFLFLILMFSFCFMIQFHSQTPFEGPWAAFAKTLVMMTSEFDYESTFTREKAENLSTPIQLLRFVFIIFLILTAIVLMNLMIGVAVHDVQNLVQDGHLKRLEKQVAFLNRLEVSRRRKKSIFNFLGLYSWFKCRNIPQTVTFKPIHNHKCLYSPSIKEAIINKVQEQFDRIEREAESNKLESKLEKLSQDVWNKMGSKFENFSQNVSNKLELKSEVLSNDLLRHIFDLKSKLEQMQKSLDKQNKIN